MKKKLIVMVLSVFMILPTLSYADTKLTYTDALKKVMDNNLSLERTKKTLDEIEDSLEEGFGITNPDPTGISVITASVQYNATIDREKATNMSYEAQKDALELSLKNMFLNIEYLEKNKEMLNKKIANMAKNISINTIKYKYGVISKTEYDNANIEMEKLKNAQKENELKISMAYKDLANIMSSKNDYKIEYIDVEYKTLLELGISKESAVGKAIAGAPSIFMQNANIRALEERIKYNFLDTSQTSLPRAEESINVSMQDLSLRMSKQNLENAVIETANAIENMELNIKGLNEQIENLENQAKNMESLVKLGFSTSIELENLRLTIDELKLQKENLLNNHNILVERYKKPYLLSLSGE